MKEHIQRVNTEKEELAEKLNKLGNFFDIPQFNDLPEKEKNLLKYQFSAMHHYLMLLEERIAYVKTKR